MKLRSSILALGMLVGIGGCQVAPGQYVIIRVANADTAVSDSCYVDNMVPDGEKDDRTDFRTGGSIAIFAADSETYFLESDNMGVATSIEGTRDGGDYSFSGEDIDVEAEYTITTTVDVDLTIKNKSVIGSSVWTQQCSGNNCPVLPSCVRTTDFVGTIVNGVELEHGV
ncbi:MAG: hypothetical protein KC486_34095 [Myxococcales bacterium]|nr:hypothetical protein [Myxococcales bacterium]